MRAIIGETSSHKEERHAYDDNTLIAQPQPKRKDGKWDGKRNTDISRKIKMSQ